MAESPATTVGDACIVLLDDQIGVEWAKKTSLETRGLAIITTSGTLVTLLLALAAIVTKAENYTPALAPRLLLIAAVAAFLFAAGLGIYCNAPLNYRHLDPASLESLTASNVWQAPGSEAQREIAIAQLEVLRAARQVNERKAQVLLIATAAQAFAVALTGVAAAIILIEA